MAARGARLLPLCLAFWQASPALALSGSAQDIGETGAAPIIDRDRADRLEPAIPRPPQISEPAPQAPVVAAAGNETSAAAVRFAQARYDGASLPQATLDAVLAPFVGKPLTRDTLQAIANAVTAAYARSDVAVFAVSIPAQVPTGGVLTVKVVEGRLAGYTLDNPARSTPDRLIRAHMQRLMGETPLRKSSLQRALSLLRDVPGQTVDAKLRQAGAPGDLTLALAVKRTQLEIGLNIDNRGVANVLQGVQAQLSVKVNGVLREGDSLRFSGYLPLHPDRYQFYSAGYATPVGSDGLTLGAQFATIRTRSSNQQTRGKAELAGLTAAYPLIRSYRTNLSVSASLDGINSSNYYLDTKFGDYRSRALRLATSIARSGKRDAVAAAVTVSQGLDLLGAREFVGFSEKDFTKLNVQALAVKKVTKTLSARVTVRAQYSRDKLPVTERASLGGKGAGLAFDVGTATAEKAVAGSIELDWKLPPAPLPKGSSVFAYVDGALGKTVARPAYALAARRVSLASAGGGVRIGFAKGWTASVEVAVPIERPNMARSAKPRFFFGISHAV